MTSTISALSTAGSSTACLSSPRSPIEPTTDERVVGADDRQLRDAVLVQEGDGVADLLVGLHGDQRRDLAGLLLGVEHVAHRLVGGALEEAVLGHPRVVVDLRQVRAPAVGEDDGDERLGVGDLPGDLERGVDGEAARAAGEDALGHRQPARGEEGVAVGDRHVAVDDRRVEGLGPEVLADALDQVRLDLRRRVDRAERVGADDLEVRVALLEVAPGARDRPAGADADHEVGDAATALLPQLGPGGEVVRLRVGRVAVLVGLEGAGDLLGQALGHPVVGLRRLRAARRSAPRRPRRRRRAGGRSSPWTSCRA